MTQVSQNVPLPLTPRKLPRISDVHVAARFVTLQGPKKEMPYSRKNHNKTHVDKRNRTVDPRTPMQNDSIIKKLSTFNVTENNETPKKVIESLLALPKRVRKESSVESEKLIPEPPSFTFTLSIDDSVRKDMLRPKKVNQYYQNLIQKRFMPVITAGQPLEYDLAPLFSPKEPVSKLEKLAQEPRHESIDNHKRNDSLFTLNASHSRIHNETIASSRTMPGQFSRRTDQQRPSDREHFEHSFRINSLLTSLNKSLVDHGHKQQAEAILEREVIEKARIQRQYVSSRLEEVAPDVELKPRARHQSAQLAKDAAQDSMTEDQMSLTQASNQVSEVPSVKSYRKSARPHMQNPFEVYEMEQKKKYGLTLDTSLPEILPQQRSMSTRHDALKGDSVVSDFHTFKEERKKVSFHQIKAKIKLKALREYKEDELKKYLEAMELQKAKEEREFLLKHGDQHLVMKKVLTAVKVSKRPELGRRRSFVECLMKYPEELKNPNPLRLQETPTLTEKQTIDKMRIAGRYPIPEKLLSQPEKYKLSFDSLMRGAWNEEEIRLQARQKPEIRAPDNSDESDDNFELYSSSSEEDLLLTGLPTQAQVTSPLTLDLYQFANASARVPAGCQIDNAPHTVGNILNKDEVDEQKDTHFGIKELDVTHFDIQAVKNYSGRQAHLENAIPYECLKSPRLGALKKAAKTIAEMQEKPWSQVFYQAVFDHFCKEFKSIFVPIKMFFVVEGTVRKLSIVNYHLDDFLAKALITMIPFLVEVDHLELINNQLNYQMAPLLLFAIFQSPSITQLTIKSNVLKANFTNTLLKLQQAQPEKLQKMDFAATIAQSEYLEPLVKCLSTSKALIKLNLGGNNFSLNSCKLFSNNLVDCATLKDLELNSCQITYQGTRYIIDALSKNITLQNINLSFNDLKSQVFEFSIKIGAIISRHPKLTHLDLTRTGLKREEVVYLGLALQMSRTMQSLHLTANDLPYYERVFLRALMAARVNYTLNYDGEAKKQTAKERNVVISLTAPAVKNAEYQSYLDLYLQIDGKRQELDFDIQKLMTDLRGSDIEHGFGKHSSQTMIDKKTQLGQLIQKIRDRDTEMKEQQAVLNKVWQKSFDAQSEAEKQETLSELKQLSGAQEQIDTKALKDKMSSEEKDMFAIQKNLRVERGRQRSERQVVAKHKGRSAAELAIMFMGINQQAYDIMKENPMLGYSSEIVFSRILVNNEGIQEASYWTDSTYCWICSAFQKIELTYDIKEDRTAFHERLNELKKLKLTMETCVNAKETENHFCVRKNVEKVIRQSKSLNKTFDYFAHTKSLSSKTLVAPHKAEQISGEQTLNIQEQTKSDNLGKFDTAVASPLITNKSPKSPFKKQFEKNPIEVVFIDQARLQRDFMQVVNPHLRDGVSPPSASPRLQQHHMTPAPKNSNYLAIQNMISPQYVTVEQLSRLILPENLPNMRDIKPMNPYGEPELTQTNSNAYLKLQKNLKDIHQGSIANLLAQGSGKFTKISPGSNQNEVIESDETSDDDFTEEDGLVQEFAKENRQRMYKNAATKIELVSQKAVEIKQLTNLQIEEQAEQLKQEQKEKDLQAQNAMFGGSSKEQAPMTESSILEQKLFIEKLKSAQSNYVSKLWPNHHIPQLVEEKMDKFEELAAGSQAVQRARQKLAKRLARRRGEDGALLRKMTTLRQLNETKSSFAVSETLKENGPALAMKNEQEPVMISGSFTDWMPQLLKTKRQVFLEQATKVQDSYAEAALSFDNQTLQYSHFVPPGVHFFFFLREGGQVFLSPRYEIARFKNSDLLLNKIVVKPRTEDLPEVVVDETGDIESVFIKDRSVFKNFADENRVNLRKAFEKDIEFSKMHRVCKSDDWELERVKTFLFEHYQKLKNIYMYYIGTSSYPTISLNDYTSLMQKSGVVDGRTISLNELDRIAITTNVAHHNLISSASRDMQRYEWLELLARIAIAKYSKNKETGTINEAIAKLLNEHIYTFVKTWDQATFMTKHCYHARIQDICKKNEGLLQQAFNTFTNPQKKFITLEEAREFVKGLKLGFDTKMVGVFYSTSLQLIVDTITDQSVMNKMRYVEFLVFLIRLSYEHFQGTVYETEETYLKLNTLLPKFLAYFELQPQFFLTEVFRYDEALLQKERDDGDSSEIVSVSH